MVAYDLDGVICEKYEIDKSYFKCNSSERKTFLEIKRYHYNNAKLLLVPEEKDFVIVSARTEKYRTITEYWLNKNNIRPSQLLLMKDKRNKRNIFNHKLDTIRNLGIIKFYEDDKKIINYLHKVLPELQIVEIEPVIKKYEVKNFSHSSLQI